MSCCNSSKHCLLAKGQGYHVYITDPFPRKNYSVHFQTPRSTCQWWSWPRMNASVGYLFYLPQRENAKYMISHSSKPLPPNLELELNMSLSPYFLLYTLSPHPRRWSLFARSHLKHWRVSLLLNLTSVPKSYSKLYFNKVF